MFAKVGESLESDLQFVRKHEIRINENNAKSIGELNSIAGKKRSLANELRKLIEVVKHMDYNNKNL